MKQWQYKRLATDARKKEEKLRLFVAAGRHKNKYATVGYLSFYGSGGKISVNLDGENESIDIHYTNLEELDEFGKVKEMPVVDMTGRPIEIDAYICYSVSAGQSSHALEIGKVIELTRVGQLKVKPLVRDGQKVVENYYSRERTVTDPFRAIKLPVDGTTMTMWIMQGFEEMGKQA